VVIVNITIEMIDEVGIEKIIDVKKVKEEIQRRRSKNEYEAY